MERGQVGQWEGFFLLGTSPLASENMQSVWWRDSSHLKLRYMYTSSPTAFRVHKERAALNFDSRFQVSRITVN